MTDDTEPDQIPTRPTALDSEGRVVRATPEPASPAAKPPEEKLELAPRVPRAMQERVDSYRADLAARNTRPWAMKLVIGALVLGLGGLGALLFFKPKLDLQALEGVREANLLDELSAGGQREPIIVSSTPTGATIFIAGKAIGQTPWAGENLWRNDTTIVIKLAGYQPFEGTLKGAQPQTFDVRLKK